MPGNQRRPGAKPPGRAPEVAGGAEVSAPHGADGADVLDFHLRLALKRAAAQPPEDPIAIWDSAI